ncbi:MAG: ABC transporter ATP-binding protein [Deltaproteobacteria bacterium]|nr:ABC transporter ATP-binding protein [Deltaproteobacteria bacterium]MBW1942306.1 ABC transporter ATP-binding protein [Deltaproteobacteria bacterium]MBW2285553.1 ABC transporter ATP-binding protein [Deltaproteobacteria bacterium]
MDQNAVEVTELTKAFGGVRAVENVSMKVPVGQRRALIGPNGAGKTTLFNCITGTFPPTSGKVFLFGKDVTRLAENRRAAMGIGRTYQITNLFHDLTVLENLILAVQGNSRQKWIMHRPVKAFSESLKRAAEELERVGLAQRAHDSVHHLSYGERRQLELALALASQPRVLFLDEPCSGLSPGERQRIAEIIREFPEDITLILIEHDMKVALGLADQVVVMHRGSIILEGTPDEVRANPEVREVYLGKV